MQRKLTAILSADVVGYSGLMERDETGTLERLKANRSTIFDPYVATHGGRVFKLMGDGALVEFSSVVAAVNCALAIQEATEEAGADDANPIRYRIGVNLGDIIIDGDDIYGEGVNVAARLQTLAPVGGVALSKTVRDHVEGKAPCTFEDMGEHTVKNIERPVHVFSVRAAERNEPEGQKVEESRKLSICVLPFANMSDDPQQEYFSDGISEDIITDLSKVSALAVISRNSAFQYKGKHIDLPKVARELKVSHVLEGSVRKAGARVRITAQLIDGKTNDHVWAERYDRDLNDIFALQDEISEAIVKALKLKLLPEEKKAIEQRGTNSLEAYNLYLMARHFYLAGNVATARASDAIVRLCRGAINIDPNYARAWAFMSVALAIRSAITGDTGHEGLVAADRALALDASIAEAHAAKGRLLANSQDFEGAWKEFEVALRLDPNSYETNMMAGVVCTGQNRFKEAIRFFEKAAELSETNYGPFGFLVGAYISLGDKENARSSAKLTLVRAQPLLSLEPDNGAAMGYVALSLAVLGESERFKEMISRGMSLDPNNFIMTFNFLRGFIQLEDIDAAIDMLQSLLQEPVAGTLNRLERSAEFSALRTNARYSAIVEAAKATLAAKAPTALPPS